MGIPMFREPSSTEASKNSATKDSSTAARSAIRRQATIRRPSRYSNSHVRDASNRATFSRRLADEIQREASGLRHQVRSPFSDPFDLTSAFPDVARREAGQRILRDALRHGQPGRRLRIPQESTLRPDMPSPPLFSADSMADSMDRLSSGNDAGNRQSSEHPPFTQRFAPAIAYHSTMSSQPPPDVLRLSPFPRLDGPWEDTAGPTVPLLRRVGQRSVNEAHRPNGGSLVDGLGDRQRSLSPDDDHENDAWETLLTTITPDANLPSTDSSFTSASASASTTAARSGTLRTSASSSQTLPSSLDSTAATVQMVLDPYPEFLNPCDYPTSSDSESSDSEAELNARAVYRRYRHRSRLINSIRRSHGLESLESTMSSQPPIPTISFSFAHPSADSDLQQMQAILDRLARREDIPDDWWAAVGLSRTLGRRIGAGDETADADGVDGSVTQRL